MDYLPGIQTVVASNSELIRPYELVTFLFQSPKYFPIQKCINMEFITSKKTLFYSQSQYFVGIMYMRTEPS